MLQRAMSVRSAPDAISPSCWFLCSWERHGVCQWSHGQCGVLVYSSTALRACKCIDAMSFTTPRFQQWFNDPRELSIHVIVQVRPGRQPAPDFVNKLLGANFAAMAKKGDPVLKPFLQVRPECTCGWICLLFGRWTRV